MRPRSTARRHQKRCELIADALGTSDAAQGLYDLAVRIGAPTSLKEIGMPLDGLDRAATLATTNPYYNPRPIDFPSVRQLLENAYKGTRPWIVADIRT